MKTIIGFIILQTVFDICILLLVMVVHSQRNINSNAIKDNKRLIMEIIKTSNERTDKQIEFNDVVIQRINQISN